MLSIKGAYIRWCKMARFSDECNRLTEALMLHTPPPPNRLFLFTSRAISPSFTRVSSVLPINLSLPPWHFFNINIFFYYNKIQVSKTLFTILKIIACVYDIDASLQSGFQRLCMNGLRYSVTTETQPCHLLTCLGNDILQQWTHFENVYKNKKKKIK